MTTSWMITMEMDLEETCKKTVEMVLLDDESGNHNLQIQE